MIPAGEASRSSPSTSQPSASAAASVRGRLEVLLTTITCARRPQTGVWSAALASLASAPCLCSRDSVWLLGHERFPDPSDGVLGQHGRGAPPWHRQMPWMSLAIAVQRYVSTPKPLWRPGSAHTAAPHRNSSADEAAQKETNLQPCSFETCSFQVSTESACTAAGC